MTYKWLTIGTMLHRTSARFYILFATLGMLLSASAPQAQTSNQRGRKYKAPPPSATITVTVLKAANGRPLEDASVIFHPIEGDKDKGGMEIHTDSDGKAMIDVIPIGDTVRLQVLARGFQTYGEDFKVDKDQMSMQVKLNRPAAEYTIYQDTKSSGSGNKSQDKSGNGSTGSGDNQQKAPDQNQQTK
jgi:5-hydroxyisourate hydrolase-like protein (transthyretin family)